MSRTVAGHVVPDGISDELARGIERYARQIDALGGYGARVQAVMPDGRVREGRLIELGQGGCQLGIITADGRRWAIIDLSRIEVAL